MGKFTTHRRRGATAGPEAVGELSPRLRAALPPRLEAVGEALASGSGTTGACEVAGGDLARDGRSLAEALTALAATSRLVRGTPPDHADTVALAVAWSDVMLGYVHDLACDDPLTGLASQAHLRSRIAEIYRAGRHSGTPAADSHALVVVSGPTAPGSAEGGDDALTRALRVARVGDTARTVFAGAETIGRVGPARVVVLAERDDRIARRAGLLRRMLSAGPTVARVWIEGLPETDDGAGRLLDELARA
ncbi:hypothetical protein [Nocardioides sp.]|uniref:hypothetical protein n=1 Tax=Nocardioides sp. TaxID=35761 RepID=UPI0037842C96